MCASSRWMPAKSHSMRLDLTCLWNESCPGVTGRHTPAGHGSVAPVGGTGTIDNLSTGVSEK